VLSVPVVGERAVLGGSNGGLEEILYSTETKGTTWMGGWRRVRTRSRGVDVVARKEGGGKEREEGTYLDSVIVHVERKV